MQEAETPKEKPKNSRVGDVIGAILVALSGISIATIYYANKPDKPQAKGLVDQLNNGSAPAQIAEAISGDEEAQQKWQQLKEMVANVEEEMKKRKTAHQSAEDTFLNKAEISGAAPEKALAR